ncbi:hypothetical protein ACL02R_08450 [Streptomyces sp. MS19]|uniref:hypothetical protein n=1 Tax=Streptomyces sp. MS19 TaxID=3385972 RepID=UPI0039A2ED95
MSTSPPEPPEARPDEAEPVDEGADLRARSAELIARYVELDAAIEAHLRALKGL